MILRLRFTNDWDDRWTEQRGQKFWLVNIGGFWPISHVPRRLIDRTSRDQAEAKTFASIEECRETLVLCGSPRGWQIIDEAGAVVE